MKAGWRIAFSLAAALAASAAQADEAAAFASPAIDHSLYREGELSRLTGTFSRWQASCDQIAKLKQRFCSLYGIGTDVSGGVLFTVIVSTGDDGKPAALLRLPPTAPKPHALEISMSAPTPPSRGKPRRAEAPMRLKPGRCDASGCVVVWRLAPPQIAALGAGIGLRVRIAPDEAAGANIEASIRGAGFAQAVAATLDPKWAGDPLADAGLRP